MLYFNFHCVDYSSKIWILTYAEHFFLSAQIMLKYYVKNYVELQASLIELF